MSLNDSPLIELARQISRMAPPSSPRGREIIESYLLPVIRSALRTGNGPGPVVHWVRSQIGQREWPIDTTSGVWEPGSAQVEALARPLARRLCERLVERLDPLPSRETVVA